MSRPWKIVIEIYPPEHDEESKVPVDDPIQKFIETGITIDQQPTSEVYKEFVEWCFENNYEPMNHVYFSRAVCQKLNMNTHGKPRFNGQQMRIFQKNI